LDRLLDISSRTYRQKRNDKNRICSVHAPEVNCTGKGKAHKDGHTLCDAIAQVERIARKPLHAFVDMGYRGNGYEG
jgi:IS5 family transposase